VPIERTPVPVVPQMLAVSGLRVDRDRHDIVVTIEGTTPTPGWRLSTSHKVVGTELEIHPRGLPPHGPTAQQLTAYRQQVRVKAAPHAIHTVRVHRANGQPLVHRVTQPGHVLTRRHDQKLVRPYQVHRLGYADAKHSVYVVHISIPPGREQAEILATLEDALLKHYRKRTHPAHPVRVDAFDKYPRKPVGSVQWTPGEDPRYTLVRRRRGTGQVIGDLLEDLFK